MIGARVTSMFFDDKRVLTPAQRASVAVRKKFGAFVRRLARQSLKYGTAPAPSGSPPTVHQTQSRTKVNKKTGIFKTQQVSPFKENIFFDLDERVESVVIGPSLLPGKVGKALPALEYGGRSAVMSHGKQVDAEISAHPTMQPAFDEVVRKNLSAMWVNAIK